MTTMTDRIRLQRQSVDDAHFRLFQAEEDARTTLEECLSCPAAGDPGLMFQRMTSIASARQDLAKAEAILCSLEAEAEEAYSSR